MICFDRLYNDGMTISHSSGCSFTWPKRKKSRQRQPNTKKFKLASTEGRKKTITTVFYGTFAVYMFPVVMVVNFLQISTNFPKNYHHVLFGCRKWIWATWKSCWTIAAEKYILLLQHCSKSKRLYFVVVLQQKSIWNHMGLLGIFYRSYSTTYRVSRARKMLQVVLDLK